MGRAGWVPGRCICETNLPEAGTPGRSEKITVNILKQIGLIVVQLAKQVWELPQTLANAVKQRRLQVILDAREAERLDRIRHPEKYRGKEI